MLGWSYKGSERASMHFNRKLECQSFHSQVFPGVRAGFIPVLQKMYSNESVGSVNLGNQPTLKTHSAGQVHVWHCVPQGNRKGQRGHWAVPHSILDLFIDHTHPHMPFSTSPTHLIHALPPPPRMTRRTSVARTGGSDTAGHLRLYLFGLCSYECVVFSYWTSWPELLKVNN